MNVISRIFTDPACPRDEQAVDIFETCVSAGLVDAIRKAPNRESACRSLAALAEKLDEAELGDEEERWLSEWLAACSTLLDPEERTGFSHRCGR